MRMFAAAMIVMWLAAAAAAQAPAAAPTGGKAMPDTALVIIDIQAFYFEGGKLPLAGPVEASVNARALLERFRQLGRPVVHVQHLPKEMTAPDPTGCDPEYRIHPNVLPAPGELVIGKHFASSFRGTDLEARLRAMGVGKLVICGMQTHMCVEAATRAAADMGFEVTVVHDACATCDLSFGPTTVPAAHVHAAALAAMSGTYARVVSTAELLAGMR